MCNQGGTNQMKIQRMELKSFWKAKQPMHMPNENKTSKHRKIQEWV